MTKIYVADFVVFGRRTRRSGTKTYTHAYAALRCPEGREWVRDFYYGFAASRELAEAQINKRLNSKTDKWTGPWEIVEVREGNPT